MILPAANTEASTPNHFSPETATPGRSTVTSLLPPEADAYFRAERLTLDGPELTLDPAFSIVIGTDGELTLSSGAHAPLRLTRGTAALVPLGAGVTTVSGQRHRDPLPASGDRPGEW